ncbi:MAG: cation transporter [Immundisolibacteraceae bacterium]|nr:cation transporter [Immundisolibacteraceae bacterium]
MRKLTLAMLAALLLAPLHSQARTVEVDVFGMTCAFCVDTLERKFNQMDAISGVEVSLKHKKIRLQTAAALPTLETIRQAVLDAGFTPTNIAVVADDSSQK